MDTIETTQAFVAEHLLGQELRLEQDPELATRARERFDQLGFSNWWIGESFGGRALPFSTGIELSRALSYGDGGLATSLYISALPTMIVELFGTKEQSERLLRPLTAGSGMAIAASEEYGSEVMRGTTSARRSDRGWVLNGTKLYSTNVAFAPHFLVLARREEEGDFRFFAVPRDAPGITLECWDMSGIRSALTYQIELRDCPVGDAELIDVDGLRALSAGLNYSRTFIAAMGLGIAERARDLCVEFARRKKFRKGVLADSPAFRQQLGEIELDLVTMEAMITRAATTLDALNTGPERAPAILAAGAVPAALAAKAVAGELAWKIAGKTSEITGAHGYTEGSLFPKLTRDARVVSFVEGGRSIVLDYLAYTRLKATAS